MPPYPPSATENSPLPPSVEVAYFKKCVELKRRINEIEEHNNAARIRKARIERGILKMRLERAFLLEQLQKRMAHNVDESDRSTSPPPTPQDKPLRSKRSHRKQTPPPPGAAVLSNPSPSGQSSFQAQQQMPPLQPLQPYSTHSTPDPHRSNYSFFAQNPGMNGTPAPPQPPNVNTPITLPPVGQTTPGFRSLQAGPPPAQSTPYTEGYSDRRSSVDFGRPIAPSVPSEANGERPAQDDTPMGEASPPQAAGGFTAVNR